MKFFWCCLRLQKDVSNICCHEDRRGFFCNWKPHDCGVTWQTTNNEIRRVQQWSLARVSSFFLENDILLFSHRPVQFHRAVIKGPQRTKVTWSLLPTYKYPLAKPVFSDMMTA